MNGSTGAGDGAARLFASLSAAGLRAAFAESCTGGLCAAAITSIPGSSSVFLGGVVAYSNASKRALLGVSGDTIQTHGAVSAEVVSEMASGAIDRFGADCGLSVSGIAGPGGGTSDKPVGTVWIGARVPGAAIERRFRFAGNREEVRTAARDAALDMLSGMLSGPGAEGRGETDRT